MKNFQEYRDEAKKKLKVADHLLNVTHPLLNDPKLLTTVLEDIYLVYENGMNSVLEHQKMHRNLKVLPKSMSPRMNIFKELAPKFEMDDHVGALSELRGVMQRKHDSAVEFIRGRNFVIADDHYNLDMLNPEKLKGELELAKDFLRKVDEVVE